ncbi:MAG: DUF805 domain-containing protein [Ruminococcus sp.]|nr:DUF805 domain-containing protein [Ruminococcus sp.]
MRCPRCSHELNSWERNCPYCGKRQPRTIDEEYLKERYERKQQMASNSYSHYEYDLKSPETVEFKDAVKLFFINYVNFKGRSTRSEFWYAFLLQIIVYICCLLIEHILPVKIFTILAQLAFLVPNLSIQFRRFHDTGRSAKFVIVNHIVSFVFNGIFIIFAPLVLFAAIGESLFSTPRLGQSFGTYSGLLLPIIFIELIVLGMNIYQIVVCCMPSEPYQNEYGDAAV